MMKSKIHRATVTGANLHYVGSVSIDTELMALAAGRAVLEDGERSGAAVSRAMGAVVAAEPLVQLDYAVLVDADTLEEVAALTGHAQETLRLLIAAQVGPVRLIDNSAALTTADDVRAVPVATVQVRQLERIG